MVTSILRTPLPLSKVRAATCVAGWTPRTTTGRQWAWANVLTVRGIPVPVGDDVTPLLDLCRVTAWAPER